MTTSTTEPYVLVIGKRDCPHTGVEFSTLTVNPPIDQWKCRSCGRTIRQNGDVSRFAMPDVPEPVEPDFSKYSYAHMRREGDWLYRSDYLHGEEEETPDEFSISDEIESAYDKFEWYRCFYEVRMDARYNLVTGEAELIGVDGVKLEKPIQLSS